MAQNQFLMTTEELEQVLGGSVESILRGPIDLPLQRCGEDILPLGGFPLRPAEYIKAAKVWLEQHRNQICAACRKQPLIANYMNGDSSYKLAQIGAILADLLMLLLKVGVSGAAWASVSLLHLGLDQFCVNCQRAEKP
jgi:hypothetical protein